MGKQEQPSSSTNPPKKRKPIGIRAKNETTKRIGIRPVKFKTSGKKVMTFRKPHQEELPRTHRSTNAILRDKSLPPAVARKQANQVIAQVTGEHNMAIRGKKHLPNYPEHLRRVIPKALPTTYERHGSQPEFDRFGDDFIRRDFEGGYDPTMDANYYRVRDEPPEPYPANFGLMSEPERQQWVKQMHGRKEQKIEAAKTAGAALHAGKKITYTRNFPRRHPLTRQELHDKETK